MCGQRAAQLLRRPVHRCVLLLVVQTGAVVAACGQLAVPEPALQLISREADSDDRDVTLGGRSPGGVAVVAAEGGGQPEYWSEAVDGAGLAVVLREHDVAGLVHRRDGPHQRRPADRLAGIRVERDGRPGLTNR